MNRRIRATFYMIATLFSAGTAMAQTADEVGASICEAASFAAAQERGIPPDVMLAITLTETGRRRGGALRPWPWTVNMQGAGHWFDTSDEALNYATTRYEAGARSFDVGCFQLNHRWHGMHFTSIEAMFNPMINARYAARFLSDLYDELGSWSAAAGAYHSRTPSYASRYTARFDEIRARLGGEVPEPRLVLAAAAPAPVRPVLAVHPFLSAGQVGSIGPYSTMPAAQDDSAAPLMGADSAATAAPLGSLATGAIETQTHSLLNSMPGALF
ncbi:MAG: transglycosylase SLT domain-containing protein [Paracoccaceae bacterium]